MKLLFATFTLAVLLSFTSNPSYAQNARYQTTAPSLDGIGKTYMGREIAGVMGWQGAGWLERQEREREERTDILVKALDLQPDMVVADIGAGTGYLSRRMASLLRGSGRVIAVDVQPEMVRMLKRIGEQTGAKNIEARLCDERDVNLSTNSVDLAIMVDVYHELAYPYEVVQSILKALKAGGQLVFVEYRAEDAKVPIKEVHKMSEVQVKLEASAHGLKWDRTFAGLPWQHMVVFRKP